MFEKDFVQLEKAVYESLSETYPRTGDVSDDLLNLIAGISSQAAVTAIRMYLEKKDDYL